MLWRTSHSGQNLLFFFLITKLIGNRNEGDITEFQFCFIQVIVETHLGQFEFISWIRTISHNLWTPSKQHQRMIYEDEERSSEVI